MNFILMCWICVLGLLCSCGKDEIYKLGIERHFSFTDSNSNLDSLVLSTLENSFWNTSNQWYRVSYYDNGNKYEESIDSYDMSSFEYELTHPPIPQLNNYSFPSLVYTWILEYQPKMNRVFKINREYSHYSYPDSLGVDTSSSSYSDHYEYNYQYNIEYLGCVYYNNKLINDSCKKLNMYFDYNEGKGEKAKKVSIDYYFHPNHGFVYVHYTLGSTTFSVELDKVKLDKLNI